VFQTGNAETGKRFHSSGFWFKGQTNIIFPVHRLIYVHLINTDAARLMIEDYSIDTRNENGKWVSSKRFYPDYGRLFWVYENAFTNAAEVRPEFSLDAAIRNRSIPLGETVKGWVLVETTDTFSSDARFNIMDSTGRRFSCAFRLPAFPTNGSDLSFQGSRLRRLGNVDLSDCGRSFYSEIQHPWIRIVPGD